MKLENANKKYKFRKIRQVIMDMSSDSGSSVSNESVSEYHINGYHPCHVK